MRKTLFHVACLMTAALGVLALAAGRTADSSSRTLTVAGSTSLLPDAAQAAKRFERAHPGWRVELFPAGSLFGLAQVRTGAVDVALSDVRPEPPLVATPLGSLPLVVVAHPGVACSSLSREALADLLAGAVRDWSQVGCGHGAPVLFLRSAASGSRLFVKRRLLGARPYALRPVVCLSNGDVAFGVRGTPGGVGLVEARYVSAGLKVLAVDGRRPGEPGYPLLMPTYFVTRRVPRRGGMAAAYRKLLAAMLEGS